MNLSNKTNLNLLRSEISAALAEVEKKHGIKFHQGGITYSADGVKCTIKLTVENTDSEVGLAESEFKKNAAYFGLKPEDYGRIFTIETTTYKIVGIRPKARKNPVIVEAHNGKRYVIPVGMVR